MGSCRRQFHIRFGYNVIYWGISTPIETKYYQPVNPLIPKSDQHPISPYNITSE